MPEPVAIATWPFGKLAAETALKSLSRGDPALDSALAGAQAVEDDYSIRTSVGFGSLPDRIGRLTLDACCMDGKTLACGAVGCVEHIKHPAALARRVMEKTPHIFLVGEAAKWFALQQGFPLEVPYTAASSAGSPLARTFIAAATAVRPNGHVAIVMGSGIGLVLGVWF